MNYELWLICICSVSHRVHSSSFQKVKKARRAFAAVNRTGRGCLNLPRHCGLDGCRSSLGLSCSSAPWFRSSRLQCQRQMCVPSSALAPLFLILRLATRSRSGGCSRLCGRLGSVLTFSPNQVTRCWTRSWRLRLRALAPTMASACCTVHCCGCTHSGASQGGRCMPACGELHRPPSAQGGHLRSTGCAAATTTRRTFSIRVTSTSHANCRSTGYLSVCDRRPTTARRPPPTRSPLMARRPACRFHVAGAMLDGCTRMVVSLRTLTNKLPRTIYQQAARP